MACNSLAPGRNMISSATPDYLQMPQQIWLVDVSRAWVFKNPEALLKENMSSSY